MTKWVPCVVLTLVLTLTYPLHAVRSLQRVSKTLVIDVVLSVSVTSYLIANIILEISPPHINDELIMAFDKNQQESYFQSFKNILDYSNNMHRLKLAGFYLVLMLFTRLVTWLSIHLRLAVVARVVVNCIDDLFHLFIQLALLFAVLGFLGHWTFGPEDKDYGSFLLSLYTLFRFFVGEFVFPLHGISATYLIFLAIYIFLVFIMMMNFLMAIIVNAHTNVTDKIQKLKTEQNVACDLLDLCVNAVMALCCGWPLATRMSHYITHTIQHHKVHVNSMPAVTALELYKRGRDKSGKQLFKSLRSASNYSCFYANKLWNETGRLALCEQKPHLCFLAGHYFAEDETDPFGEGSRCSMYEQLSRSQDVLETGGRPEMLKALRLLLPIQNQIEELKNRIHHCRNGPRQETRPQLHHVVMQLTALSNDLGYLSDRANSDGISMLRISPYPKHAGHG